MPSPDVHADRPDFPPDHPFWKQMRRMTPEEARVEFTFAPLSAPVVRGGELVEEELDRHPTAGALAADTWTCNRQISLDLQRRRGQMWGNVCRTLNYLPDGDARDLVCGYCRQATR